MPRTPPAKEGRNAPPAADLDAMLDKMDPPEEPRPEDPRMGIPEGWSMIHTLMSRILRDVGPVAKDQVNTHQKYNFRGVDQVVNAVNAAFKRHQVFPTSKILEFGVRDTMTTGTATTPPRPAREATMRIEYTFHAPDGSAITTEVPGEALDQSDKTSPKAMSVGLRIALLQMLLLPTDDPTTDHEYQTRDGVGSMSASVARYALDRVTSAGLDELLGPLRSVIAEHAAWERPVPGDGGTWYHAFADRLASIIAEIASYEEGKRVKEALGEARMLGGKLQDGRTMADLLTARGLELRELYANTLNHVTGQILKAAGQDELDIAIGCGWAALEAGTILEAGLNQALRIADERRPKLPEYAPHPADDDGALEDEAAAEENPVNDGVPFDGPYVGDEPGPGQWGDPGDAHAGALVSGYGPDASVALPEGTWEQGRVYSRDAFIAFKARAEAATVAGLGEQPGIRQNAVLAALTDLLTSPEDTTAYDFGTDGFVVVADAIKAAHRREQTISDTGRQDMDERLERHLQQAGMRQA